MPLPLPGLPGWASVWENVSSPAGLDVSRWGLSKGGLSFFWKSEGAIGGETYKGGTGKRVWGCDFDVKWTKKSVIGKKQNEILKILKNSGPWVIYKSK